MDRDRFDDVEFHIVEEPEPPRPRRPRRLRRWALAAGGSVLVAGALAAGASALTGSNGQAKAPSAAGERALGAPAASSRPLRGHPCHHGQSDAGWTAYSPLPSRE
jgi:hypothetical protein